MSAGGRARAFRSVAAAVACLVLLTLTALPGASPARADAPGPPAADGLPVRVKPTLRVDQIPDVSERDGLFRAVVTLTYEWHDSRLAFDALTVGRDAYEFVNEAARARIASIWTPKMAIANAIETPRTIGLILVIRDDGTVQLSERVAAVVEADYALADFPFDRQRPTVRLASTEFSREIVMLRDPEVIPNHRLAVKNWDVLRTTADIGETASITGRPLSTCFLATDIKRAPSVAVTQIFMPYLAIMFLPLVCLFNVTSTTPTQLFTALLALLTLNFKVVLEQPTIISVNNSIVDAMWMGYCFIGINLMLVFTVMRVRSADAPPLGDLRTEVRNFTRWAIPAGFLILVSGRVLLAQN